MKKHSGHFQKQHRLPWAPLEPFIEGVSGAELSRSIKIRRQTLIRWRADGEIPMYGADRIAVGLGHHPGEIWPEWFEVAQ